MKLKFKLLILCAAVTLCALPLAFTGCLEGNETENKAEYSEWVTITLPTCEKAGLQQRTLLANPLVVETRDVPATGHDWNGWQTTTQPTCLLAGVETRTCNTCENSDYRSIPALGHDWDEWETLSEATCESAGAQQRTCLRDGKHTELNAIPKLGHDYTDWVITLAPTCMQSGVETRYCRNNNAHIELRSVEPYGHNWGAYVVTKPATCTEDGIETKVCVNDSSHVYTDSILRYGHSFGDWVTSVPATESEDGVDIRVCSRDSSHTETRIAYAMGSENLTFTLNSAGTEYSVKSYSGKSIVYIPAVHNGLPVTKIERFFGRDAEYVKFLGNNLKTINSMAFASCSKLQSIEIPEGVTSIGTNAFAMCTNLKSITLPSTVAQLGSDSVSIFVGCTKLETITVAEGNPVYKVESGCLINKTTNSLLGGTVNAVIPDYVTSICGRAFLRAGNESVRIPASVSNVGVQAFNGWKAEQTIVVEGFASQEEADAAWGSSWRTGCYAQIIYEG